MSLRGTSLVWVSWTDLCPLGQVNKTFAGTGTHTHRHTHRRAPEIRLDYVVPHKEDHIGTRGLGVLGLRTRSQKVTQNNTKCWQSPEARNHHLNHQVPLEGHQVKSGWCLGLKHSSELTGYRDIVLDVSICSRCLYLPLILFIVYVLFKCFPNVYWDYPKLFK